MDYLNCGFGEAIAQVGDYLNAIPREQLARQQRAHKVAQKSPPYFRTELDNMDNIKKAISAEPSRFNRACGLGDFIKSVSFQGLEVKSLMNEQGDIIDLLMIESDGTYKTSSGNTYLSSGCNVLFGHTRQQSEHHYITDDNRLYIATTPHVAARSSVQMRGAPVYCVFDPDHVWDFVKHVNVSEVDIVYILASSGDLAEADALKLKQMIYDNRTMKLQKGKTYEYGNIQAIKQSRR